MTGCKYNAQRKIIYPKQVDRTDRGQNVKTFAANDEVRLVCPNKCEDVVVTVRDGYRRGNI